MSRGVLLLLAAGVGSACAYANGYDPARYASPAPTASVDPEVEPLAAEPKRRMHDPRGTASARPALARVEPGDAGAAAAPIVAVTPGADAGAPAWTCGSKADPCPMQRFMHGAMATAHTPDTLTAAFTRVAGMSPEAAWSWVAIATRGANLANAGDVAGAKAQCDVCHDAYREPYRAQHRARPL
ncbi:MAG TPA: hypothetical protein VLT33_52025 [Labilithrix sp.]|nr:hypothetical protein [Labilithrix sp.]